MKQLVIALILLWGTSEAAAACDASNTLYVATTGNDANAGSLNQPLATPGTAIQKANASATVNCVLLRAGRYTVTQQLAITKPGLTIATNSGETARAALVAGTSRSSPDSVIAVYASGVTIQNLEIQGGAFYGIKLDDANGPKTGQNIIGNYIHHTGRDGIKSQRADNVLIANNEIGPTGVRDASNAEGIDMIGSIVAVIRDNYIHDATTNGLYVKGGTRNATVEGNLVVNSGTGGILLGSETDAEFIRDSGTANNPGGHEALSSIARNNIVVNTGGAGLMTIAGKNVQFLNNTLINVATSIHAGFRAAPNQHGTAPDGVTFKNNVVVLAPSSVRPLLYTFRFCAVASDPTQPDGMTSDGNVWFSNGGSSSFVLDTSPASCVTRTYSGLADWRSTGNDVSNDVNAMTANPNLDPNNLYRPLAGSQVVDKGVVVANVPDDYAGVPRPQGGVFDIGAHEKAVGSTSVPPSLPTAPAALDATATGSRSVNLMWRDESSTEAGFRIERSADGGHTFAVIATVSGQVSYTDTNVAANTTYSYRVAAYNTAGISPYSNVDTVKTPRR